MHKEIDEAAFEEIGEAARIGFKRSQRNKGCRGQQFTKEDSWDYWIILATLAWYEDYLIKNHKML